MLSNVIPEARVNNNSQYNKMAYGNKKSSSSVGPLGLKILLVEDDEADAYLIRRALEKNSWVGEVVLAEDSVEALELFDKGRIHPDLAIVDLHLPRKDGLALMKDFAIRESAQFPFMVLTSSKASKDAIRALKRGAMEFVTKPKTEEQLVAALNRVISKVF